MKYLFVIAAGACDTATGLLLLFAPMWTLRLMRIEATPTEPVYLQWIGAFVFSVGASYFLPFLRPGTGRFARMLEGTAWVRIVIGSFVLASVLRGALEPRWLSVAATDGLLACVQIALLQRKVFTDAD